MRISDWSSDVCSSDLSATVACPPPIVTSDSGANTAHRLHSTLPISGLLAAQAAILDGNAQRALHQHHQIGRASCRERVCKYVSISVAAVSCNKTTRNTRRAIHTIFTKTL